eukprot:216495-Rhodomonas_salina.1
MMVILLAVLSTMTARVVSENQLPHAALCPSAAHLQNKHTHAHTSTQPDARKPAHTRKPTKYTRARALPPFPGTRAVPCPHDVCDDTPCDVWFADEFLSVLSFSSFPSALPPLAEFQAPRRQRG